VRRRLLASYVAFAAVVLLVLEVPLGLVAARQLRSDALAGLDNKAVALAALAAEDLEHHDTIALAAATASYARRTGVDAVVLDASGAAVALAGAQTLLTLAHGVLRAPGPVSGDVPSGSERLLWAARPVPEPAAGEHLTPAASPPPSSAADADGVVLVATSSHLLDDSVHRLMLGLGVTAAAVVALAVTIGLVLSGSLTRPLRRLEHAVAAIGNGDLGARAPESEGPGELRTLAATLNAMAVRLERLLVAQRDFVADASHQLRSPLTALRLRLENLASRAGPADREDLDASAAEVQRLSRLVDGLLALARAEAGPTERAAVDVVAVARERHGAWAALAEERQVHLAVEAPAHAVTVLAVPGHVEQILDNLLDNAVEATPSGGTVVVRVAASSGAVELHVVDEGPGLPPHVRRRAFDRFWRGTPGGGGSGLGLAIVQRLAEACGGSVELQDAPTGGLDAVVRLRST